MTNERQSVNAAPVTALDLLIALEAVDADGFGQKLLRRLTLVEAFAKLTRDAAIEDALRGLPRNQA